MTHRPRFRGWACAAAALLTLPLVWLVVVAHGWTINRLVVAIWVRTDAAAFGLLPDDVAVILNTVMLVPLVILISLALPRVRWWVWAVAGLVISSTIEGVQLLLSTRNPSLVDVVFNTLGALAGAAVGRWLNRVLDDRAARARADD